MTLYAIGDIQGCRAAFDALLERLAFQPARDRLWLVGDLVNRGPDSLGVLRSVIALGDAATCVLGNHDLHLLAVVAGARAPNPNDTFHAVLRAPDAADLVDWLRRRPLLHHDERARRVLVHAGIPPHWDVDVARGAAQEVEALLRGERWQAMLHTMYGNEPAAWRADLVREDRCRYTINALTRMRYVDQRGELDMAFSGPPGSQPPGLLPWFEAPDRAARDTHIVFGHWAALGLLERADVTALDTACVWGGALTAMPLEPRGRPVWVSCGELGNGAR
jgi:bis(5'-nucleosyl)-tetraphosphatase (symmetrical)